MNNKLQPQIIIKNLLNNRSICLVGLMGVGKSSIATHLAGELDMTAYDSDQEIELSSNFTISEIFSKYGEAEFRRLEYLITKRILSYGNVILASGGGAFANTATRNVIQDKSISIWIHTDIKTILGRLQKIQSRPLLAGKDANKVMKNMLATRREYYNQADIKINCGESNKQQVTQKILLALQNYLELENAKNTSNIPNT